MPGESISEKLLQSIISDHVVVLNYGKKIFEGTADQTKNSKEVIEAYLGVDE